jgi:repressor LexA
MEVFTWVVTFIGMHGYPPSRKEISARFGWSSPNAAQGHLEQLQSHGLLKLNSKVARGIQVLQVVA